MNYAKRDKLHRRVIVRMLQISAGDSPFVLQGYLSATDRDRAARFRLPEDRKRFLTGRGLLGRCLTEYLGYPLEPIQLAYSSQGRPFLYQEPEVQFSLTHSGEWVALALSLQSRVGVDLEQMSDHIRPLELARKIFSQSDFARFKDLPENEMSPAFFHAWTGKEAYLKAIGRGIAEGLREVSVPPRRDDASPQEFPAPREPGAGSWQIQSLPLSADYMGNVVWDDPRKILDLRVIGPDINLDA